MTRKEKFNALPEEYKNMVLCFRYPNVLHKDVEELTGGALSRSRLANILCECSEDERPPTFKIMSKNASDLVDLVFWIHQRTEKMNGGRDN